MGATSVTRSNTSILDSVLDKVRGAVEDQITANNKLLYFYRKSGNWKRVSSGGDRYRVSLMYELGAADSYSSFGQIDVTPSDGMTSAFFDWRQAAAAVSISGLEEFKNRGTERVFDLLKERTTQSVLGLETLFSKGMLQGQRLGGLDLHHHGADLERQRLDVHRSALNAAGLPTRIESGSVWVSKDTLVVRKGEPINERLAGVLSKLGIKAVELGISISIVLDVGLIITNEQLKLELEQTKKDFGQGFGEAFALSLEVAFPTKENLTTILQVAHQKAFALSLNAAIPTKETAVDLIRKANAEMTSLKTALEKVPPKA